MPRRQVVPVPLAWMNAATGQTASRPGAGYWVGMGESGGRFSVTVAYDETVVGYYAVASEDDAFVILRTLARPLGANTALCAAPKGAGLDPPRSTSRLSHHPGGSRAARRAPGSPPAATIP